MLLQHRESIGDLANEIVNPNHSIPGSVGLRLVNSRECQYMPSHPFQGQPLGLVPELDSLGVVPISTVILDCELGLGEAEVNVEFVHCQQWDRGETGSSERLKYDRLVPAQTGVTLLPTCSPAKIEMSAFASTNLLRRVGHQCGTFLGGKRSTVSRIARIGAKQPFRRVLHKKSSSTHPTDASPLRCCSLFHISVPAVARAKHLFSVARLHTKRLVTSLADQVNWHPSIIPKPNGSLTVLPVLGTALGEE